MKEQKEETLKLTGTFSPLFKSFIYYVYGSLFIYLLAFVSYFIAGLAIAESINFIQIFVYSTYGFTVIGLILIAANLVVKTIKTHFDAQNSLAFRKSVARNLWVLLGCLFLSVIVWGIWRINSPLQTTLNWDIYHHQALANIIQQNEFHLFTSGLSDTFQFDGYSTLFHTLLVTPQALFHIDILEFWWFAEFFHLFTAILASFLVGYAFSNRMKVGLIAAVFGAFIFEANGAYTSLFLIPQNLSAIVGAVFIAHLIYAKRLGTERLVDISTVLFAIFIILNHIVIGFLVAFMLWIATAYLWLNQRYKTKWVQIAFVLISLITLVAFPLVTGTIDLDTLNRGEAAFFNYTYEQKYDLMKDVYGYSLLVFLPLGLLYSAKRRSLYSTLLVVLSIGLITLTISPIPYALKLYAFGRFFVHALLALGMWLIVKNLGSRLYWVALILLTLSLTLIFITNTVKFKQVPTYGNLSTHVSPHEIEAAKFLRENYLNQNVLLLADPATMHILEGLSAINTPGGAYTDTKTRKLLSDIYYVRDSETMSREIFKARDLLTDEKPDLILLAINGRFKRWQEIDDERKYGIHWNVWTPRDLTMDMLEAYDFIDFVSNTDEFDEVFKSDGIVVFEVRERIF